MRKVWKACTFIVLGIAVILFFTEYRKATPVVAQSDSIVGTWQDEYGLKKYTFTQGGRMKIQALNIGSFDGKYDMQDGQITIEYNILMKKERNTYAYELKNNKLYLDGKIFTRKK